MKTKPASSVTLCFYPAALALVELLPPAANRAVGSVWIKGRQQLHLPRTSMCVWAHGCYLPKTVRNGTCMCKLMEHFTGIYCVQQCLPLSFPPPRSVWLLSTQRVCESEQKRVGSSPCPAPRRVLPEQGQEQLPASVHAALPLLGLIQKEAGRKGRSDTYTSLAKCQCWCAAVRQLQDNNK